MTEKEAIYILRNAAWLGSDADRQKVEEAVEVVANAIEAQDMTLYMNLPEVSAEEAVEILKRNNRIELIPSDKDTNVPSKDAISRKQAIDAIVQYLGRINRDFDNWKGTARIILDHVPSADVQPDTKELIAKIKNGISATNADDVYSCGMRNAMRWVLSLIDGKEPLFENCPSAQPERKKGTYTASGENAEWYCWYATCNECGKEWMGSRNFCPHCGCKMER